MDERACKSKKRGFGLVELLITVAVVSVLVVVALSILNPAQVNLEAQDARRSLDVTNLNKSIQLYYSEALTGGNSFSLGSSSVVYVSVPDTSASCSDLGLPSLPNGCSYHCAPPSTYTDTNGSGWIPVNFSSISSGNPLTSLPVDPVNTTSSGELYAYQTDGTHWEIAASPASQKYISQSSTFVGGSLNELISNACPLLALASNGGGSGSSSGGGGGTVTYTTSTFSLGISATTSLSFGLGAFDVNTQSFWTDYSVSGNAYYVIRVNSNGTTTSVPVEIWAGAPFFAYDSNNNTVWTTRLSTGPPSYTSVQQAMEINDTAPYATTTYTMTGSEPWGIVYDPHTNTVWVGSYSTPGYFNEINVSSSVVTAYGMGSSGPDQLVYDSNSPSIWASDPYVADVMRIDDTTHATTTVPVASTNGPIAFDSSNNTIWAFGGNTMNVISDSAPYATSSFTVTASSVGMAFDPHTNSVWVATNSNTVLQVDGQTHAVTTYPIVGTSTGASFDPTTNAIWVLTGGNTVTVFTPSR